MTLDYHARRPFAHVDGTPRYSTESDRVAEADVADRLAQAWRCELHEFGGLCPIDRYATRFGRTVAVIEIKVRSHALSTYPTLYLSAHKWIALTFVSIGLACHAVFVARLVDGVYWVRLDHVDATKQSFGGTHGPESMILVPTTSLRPLVQLPPSCFAPRLRIADQRE